MTKSDDLVDVAVVYGGLVYNPGNATKAYDAWALRESVLEADLDKVAWRDSEAGFGFWKAERTARVPGGVYRAKGRIDENRKLTSLQLGSLVYTGLIDQERRTALAVADEAAHQRKGAAAAEKRAKGEASAFKRLDPLRALYRKMPWAERPAFERMVVDYLRGREL